MRKIRLIVCACLVTMSVLVKYSPFRTTFGGIIFTELENWNIKNAEVRRLGGDKPDCDVECVAVRATGLPVNCAGLISRQKNAQNEAELFLKTHPNTAITDESLAKLTKNCETFLKIADYPRVPLSEEEANFPIAYSIVAHRDAVQIEGLLGAIYWPQNWYCIHLDRKAPPAVEEVVTNLVKCLPNVIVPSRRETVIYAGISRLKADLNCMEELLKGNMTWKYLINLTGQEYPLRTNVELVKIMKKYNGTSDIESLSLTVTQRHKRRFNRSWRATGNGTLVSGNSKGPPPGNITLVKGMAFGVFTRAFVNFTLTDRLVQEFLLWLDDTYSPDELFWSTINSKLHNPMFNAPGGFDGVPEKSTNLIKYVMWINKRGSPGRCHGKRVHWSCVFSFMDLPTIVTAKHLFVNKFDVTFDYLALYCMHEWFHNRTYLSPKN